MNTLHQAKQYLAIEAVRRGLAGDDAVAFFHHSGYAMSSAGIARHLRHMGGRARIQQLIDAGRTTPEILAELLPEEDFTTLMAEHPPAQADLFGADEPVLMPEGEGDVFETTRLSVRIPNDVYEALRIACRVEGKTQSHLVSEILTRALSGLPRER